MIAVWCDGCASYIDEVRLTCSPITVCCAYCGTMVMKDMTPNDQKQTKMDIAKGIWGL